MADQRGIGQVRGASSSLPAQIDSISSDVPRGGSVQEMSLWGGSDRQEENVEGGVDLGGGLLLDPVSGPATIVLARKSVHPEPGSANESTPGIIVLTASSSPLMKQAG